ncbi:hypothetical protein R3P38DRAFT_2758823 [Favolaschia claudopus]|uniref:BZIP domain-containing protein n=1 Tax=Favolaschia claudopus TaxID=2862362 RepID=A0AAW0E531_9AGAR
MVARVAWKRSSGEYSDEGDIAAATGDQMDRAQMEKTNDRYGSGGNRQQKISLAQHRKEKAEAQIEKTRRRAEKKKAASDAIDRVIAILTITEVEYSANLPLRAPGYLSVPLIDAQEDLDPKKTLVPKKGARGNRENRVKLWREAVECRRYLEAGLPRDFRIERGVNPETPEMPDEDQEPRTDYSSRSGRHRVGGQWI